MNKFKRIAFGLVTGLAGALLTVSIASASTNQDQNNNDDNVQDTITRQVSHMSWRQKISQMIVGANLSNNPSQAAKEVRRYQLGGVLLNGNITRDKRLDYSMQRASHNSLLIGTDQEGGEVSRLSYNPSRYPSPRAAYRRGGWRGITKAYSYSAWKLRKLGINWNYAPDADVATSGYMNQYQRSFGKGPKMTAKYISYAVPAIQHQHVAATLKHFPGYGNANKDTDFASVISNRSIAYLKRNDFLPFKAGINKDVDSVMITNIILNKVQRSVPATLSRKDISLLRNDLHFNGVIVTDSLDAKSISSYAYRHHVSPAFLAMKAGNDMIMTSGSRKYTPQLTWAVKHGKLSKKQINASVRRILTMKAKLGLNY